MNYADEVTIGLQDKNPKDVVQKWRQKLTMLNSESLREAEWTRLFNDVETYDQFEDLQKIVNSMKAELKENPVTLRELNPMQSVTNFLNSKEDLFTLPENIYSKLDSTEFGLSRDEAMEFNKLHYAQAHGRVNSAGYDGLEI